MATTTAITVEQIHCEACENTIRTALGRVKGIRDVQPNTRTNTVTLTYEESRLGEDEIRARLADIGFDPVEA